MKERIRLLDILRGFAILGTLGTNVWFFAYAGDTFATDQIADEYENGSILESLVSMFVYGKMLSLLTIMFGVGLELKYQQAKRKNMTWPGTYLWILLFLFIEGFVHFALVMEYDVLMSYAITGLLVAFIVRGGSRRIKKGMIVSGVIHLLVTAFLVVFSFSELETESYDGSSEPTYEEQLPETWISQVQDRLQHFLMYREEAIFIIPMNTFLFLLGVRMMRAGVFYANERGQTLRKTLFRMGLWIGLPLNALVFVPNEIVEFVVRYVFSPFLSIFYIAVVAKLLERTESWFMWTWFEYVGKMALSCYILQNVICSLLFYSWGLGLGGQINAPLIVLSWLFISLLQIAISALCLNVWRIGPMEYIRSQALRWVTMKKAS
ncbi:membrane protein [Bacillus sp. LK10]|uniref:DUF418 domain-containing protein n=1 Tax=Bacillus sp. LK10 TaxID=1628211 RepID=UPI00064F9416|nr:DUF418 domain-containing protein [Bacillus sp. LK10]KML15549.1 membrane protein [Bacillus stratosphericus]KML62230.1 membrane protein [Bacillus stratosphericus]KMN32782.1 membrane protein [Bacillus stratosphericus]KMN74329.1 membrane protein [Bacillus sp. LK10]